jgi:TolB protein
MNIENEETYRLTESHGSDWDPVWSPDGQSIVFVSDRDDNYEIYVMNTDGSGQTRLTNNDYEDWQPTWSPDGQRIAFSSYRYQYKHDIISINIDGSDLTVVSQNAMDNQWPAWSPDGEWIAFSVNGQESPWTPIYYDWDICIAHPDGSGFARLMDSPGPDWGPAWFPDSRQLIFTSERSGYYQMEFYTINWDGTGQTRFMPKTGLNFHPSWSPNGDYLIFTSDLAGNYDVYVINADGSGLRNLTSNQAKDLSGSWRP